MKRHELSCLKPHHANHAIDKKTGMDCLITKNCGE